MQRGKNSLPSARARTWSTRWLRIAVAATAKECADDRHAAVPPALSFNHYISIFPDASASTIVSLQNDLSERILRP